MTLNILDAFSGSGNWVYPWKKTVSFDIHIDSIDILNLPHITHCLDIRNFVPDKEYHIVYASFPCTHFSRLKATNKKKTTDKDWKEALDLANIAFELSKHAKLCYVIENPFSGYAPKIFPNYKIVDYSMYGFCMRKRTAIWSNLPLNLKTQKEVCYNKRPLSSLGVIERSAIPIPLSEYIKRIIIRTFNKELQDFKLKPKLIPVS